MTVWHDETEGLKLKWEVNWLHTCQNNFVLHLLSSVVLTTGPAVFCHNKPRGALPPAPQTRAAAKFLNIALRQRYRSRHAGFHCKMLWGSYSMASTSGRKTGGGQRERELNRMRQKSEKTAWNKGGEEAVEREEEGIRRRSDTETSTVWQSKSPQFSRDDVIPRPTHFSIPLTTGVACLFLSLTHIHAQSNVQPSKGMQNVCCLDYCQWPVTAWQG